MVLREASETKDHCKQSGLGCWLGSNVFVNSGKAGAGSVQSTLRLADVLQLAVAGPGRTVKQEVAWENCGDCHQNPQPTRTQFVCRVTTVTTLLPRPTLPLLSQLLSPRKAMVLTSGRGF